MSIGKGHSPHHSAWIAHYRDEQAKLLRSIEAMESKTMGVGDPVTIPHAINEATHRMIAELKRGIAEWELAIEEFEKVRRDA